MSAAPADLRHELGADVPAAIAALPAADVAKLAAALHLARETQAAALLEATDSGLNFIPRIARGAVKKVLFG